MVEVKWTDQAIHDIDQIAEFISKDSLVYASLVVERIFHIEDSLKKQPKLGKSVREFKYRSLREIVEGNYRIIYKIISPLEIHIITVHHGARNLNKRTF